MGPPSEGWVPNGEIRTQVREKVRGSRVSRDQLQGREGQDWQPGLAFPVSRTVNKYSCFSCSARLRSPSKLIHISKKMSEIHESEMKV